MYKCNDNAMHCIVNCSRYGFELKFIQNAKVGVAFEILRKLLHDSLCKNCKKKLGGQPVHVDMDIHIIKNITVKYSHIKVSTLPCAYRLSICNIHIVYFSSSSKMEN